jgi:hypothetical protein
MIIFISQILSKVIETVLSRLHVRIGPTPESKKKKVRGPQLARIVLNRRVPKRDLRCNKTYFW